MSTGEILPSFDGILDIKSLKAEMGGKFECVAENGVDVPLRKEISVKVYGKAKSTKGPALPSGLVNSRNVALLNIRENSLRV